MTWLLILAGLAWAFLFRAWLRARRAGLLDRTDSSGGVDGPRWAPFRDRGY